MPSIRGSGSRHRYDKSPRGGQMLHDDCSNARQGTPRQAPAVTRLANFARRHTGPPVQERAGTIEISSARSIRLDQFGLGAASFAAFLHSDMNFLRSLP
jgi:hypothetical protein